MVTVAIYLRVSQGFQREYFSKHLKTIAEYCKKRGWKVVMIFVDICSKDLKERDGMNKAMKEHKAFDKLVAVKLDRFGNRAVTYGYEFFFRNKGIGLVAVKENVDSQEDWKRFVTVLYSTKPEEKDQKRKEVTKRGIKQKKEKLLSEGKNPSLKPFYGLKKDNRLAYEVTFVWQMFNLYLYHHLSVQEIACYLNNEGIPSPEGKKWRGTSVWNILTNHIYVEIGVGITEYMYQRVQKKLALKKGGAGKHMLDHLLFCNKCKGKMNLISGKYYCKTCKGFIDQKKVEEKVFQEVKRQMGKVLSKYTIYTVYNEKVLQRIGDEYLLGNDTEKRRVVRNWIALELGKKVLVDNHTIVVIGLGDKEIEEILK